MEYQADYTASLLNNSYTFQNISGKNATFGAIVQNMPFYFRSNTTKSRAGLCVHAGGEITYSTPVKFAQSPLPYTMLLFITAGEATILYNESSILLSKNDILLLPCETALQFSTTLTPFSYTVFIFPERYVKIFAQCSSIHRATIKRNIIQTAFSFVYCLP